MLHPEAAATRLSAPCGMCGPARCDRETNELWRLSQVARVLYSFPCAIQGLGSPPPRSDPLRRSLYAAVDPGEEAGVVRIPCRPPMGSPCHHQDLFETPQESASLVAAHDVTVFAHLMVQCNRVYTALTAVPRFRPAQECVLELACAHPSQTLSHCVGPWCSHHLLNPISAAPGG